MKQKTIEEYIEIIYVLEKKEGCAHTGVIASEMGVKPSSVTEMLQKLQKEGLVEYKPYVGVELTGSGLKKARQLMKKHRTLADFLEIIGVHREIAETDACRIEHHVSPATMSRLEKFVDYVQNAPQTPKWLERFEHYYKNGESPESKDIVSNGVVP